MLAVGLLRAAAVAATLACVLAPASASACQWEIYQHTTHTPAGPVTHPMAHCVSP